MIRIPYMILHTHYWSYLILKRTVPYGNMYSNVNIPQPWAVQYTLTYISMFHTWYCREQTNILTYLFSYIYCCYKTYLNILHTWCCREHCPLERSWCKHWVRGCCGTCPPSHFWRRCPASKLSWHLSWSGILSALKFKGKKLGKGSSLSEAVVSNVWKSPS